MTVEIGGEEFSAKGLAVIALNYLEVYPYDRWAESTIPNMPVGMQI